MLRLFGYPRFDGDEGKLELPPFKPVCLLVYLAMQQSWVSRELLATLFWPDSDDLGARRNLRMMLSRTKELGWAQGLEVSPSQLRWQLPTDYQAFREALGAGHWSEAIHLHEAPLLEGWRVPGVAGFEEWLLLERQSLMTSWREASLKQAQVLKEQQAYSEISQLLGRLLRYDPLEEDVVQAYLEAAYLAGKRDEALKIYERFVLLLEQELGLKPLQQTQELAAMIRQASALPIRLALKDKAKAPLSVQRPPFFKGRERERQQFESSSAQVLLVSGEPGVGKSRFLRETLGFECCHLQCREGLEKVAYYPIVSYLKGLGELPDLGAYQVDVARLIPERFSGLIPETEALTAKTRLLEALAQVFEAQNQPLLIEDLQWADEASLEFLVFLSIRTKLRLFGSYRSTEISPQLHKALLGWQSGSSLELIPLEVFGLLEMQDLLASLSAHEPAPELFSRWLYQHTGGNIFFALETLKTLFESSVLVEQDGHWLSSIDAVTKDYSELETPDSIHDVISRRIHKLPEAAQRVLQIASVIGQRFSADLLAPIAGLSEWGALEALEQAELAGIIAEDHFVHDLFRQSIYSSLAASKRKAVHAQVADLLKDRLEPLVVAGHYLAAGRIAHATEWFLESADLYHRKGLHHEAIAVLKQLIAIAEEARQDQAKVKLLSLYVELALVAEAENLITTLSKHADVNIRATSLQHKAMLYLEQGKLREASDAFAHWLEAPVNWSKEQRIQQQLLRAQLAFYHGHYEDCLAISEATLKTLRQEALSLDLVNTLTNMGAALDVLQRHQEARQYHLEAFNVAKILHAAYAQVSVMINVLWNAMAIKQPESILSLAEEVISYGDYNSTMTLRLNLAACYIDLGEFDKAQLAYEYLAHKSTDPTLKAIAWARLAALYAHGKTPPRVQEALEQALYFCQQTDFRVAHVRVGISTLYYGSDAQVKQILPLLKDRVDFDVSAELELKEALAHRQLPYPLGESG